ncbi:damage-inducible protein DinB [Bacillus inaquosorum]|uniref:damage-inducible protein DinB n=1 Tax=Bacillus inaquosorum TaxID=483913 RepID=UPI000745B661|nr:damage-inducible protein DinB [Bacillus inaquosorum]PPA36170.1 damage-inducible protein DinB [Bacillus subtilis]AMA51269.1 damage-inducible protein DinB [Bacillus inaquosorum]MBT2193191.1 damage-inducible protein DinB [Bacillus inaquosorum]MBT3119746.1 damage-inducible protein DinB [Bacillus inaquosorum]MBT3124123.1 damage-inducible protein DinB [Bacillus inaquosorum]
MSDFSLKLYEYNVWANQQIFSRLKELPKEVYRQDMQSVFPSISHVLSHVYLSDLGWIEVFSGKSLSDAMALAEQLKEQTEAKEMGEMEALFLTLSERYTLFLKQKEQLNKPLQIQNPSGGIMKTTVSELVPHVVNHGTYHRGNITAMLRQAGYASAPTDYGLYLYIKKTEMA